MSDNLFSAVLTFGLMAAGTFAVGSEMIGHARPAAAQPTACVTLEPVIVTGHRQAVALDTITLPAVTVTGRRASWVAADDHEPATRVE